MHGEDVKETYKRSIRSLVEKFAHIFRPFNLSQNERIVSELRGAGVLPLTHPLEIHYDAFGRLKIIFQTKCP